VLPGLERKLLYVFDFPNLLVGHSNTCQAFPISVFVTQ